MSLDLHKNARPDEHFFLNPVQGMPVPIVLHKWYGRKIQWNGLLNEDGSPCDFTSLTIFRFFRFYKGKPKCDSTRTEMYWNGQLGTPNADEPPINRNRVVLTDTKKEQFSVRLLWFRSPDAVTEETWRNMGGFW